MEALRKEDLSLHHYLRFNVLNKYIETDVDVELEYVDELSSTGSYVYEANSTRMPIPTSLGRGWVYLDNYPDVSEQQTRVKVYDAVGTIISGSNYMIDYIDGRVVFANKNITPVKATYDYFYVALVNDWEVIENSGVPVVVVDLESFQKVGFQLGGGKLVPRRGHLHIFATDRAERDDLIELLYDGINEKCVPNQDWPKGTMLDWDGTFNVDYEYKTVEHASCLHIENVIATTLNPPLLTRIPRVDYRMLSDLNRYRARIDFDMFYWREY